jgi:hypothetical protein
MAYTYETYKAALAELLVVDVDNAEYVAVLPSIITYADERCYRDLDLLSTVVRDTGLLTSGTRTFTLPQNLGRFVVTNGVNIITPSSVTIPEDGTRNQCTPVSRDYMDAVWSSTTGTGVPTDYAMITDQVVIFGPFPDDAYTAEVIGTIRPTPLSEDNPTTYLSTYLPDLFMAASMVFGSGWQKNFGSQADDPKMAVSWEGQYQALFASANVEEMRKKYASGAWGSLQPTPIATPSR